MANLEAETDTNPAKGDSDIEGLLSPKPTKTTTVTNDETKSLRSALDGVASTLQPQRVGIVDFLIASIGLLILNKPKQVMVSIGLFFLALIVIINLTLSNDSAGSIYRIIDTDYSGVMSKYDLTAGKIDHWCLAGGDKICRCEDPLLPSDKMSNSHWTKAHFMNKACVDDKIYEDEETEARKDIDVLFIGENIVEAWAGRWLGINNTHTHEVKESFDKHFNKAKGGKYDGVALGIAGDTAPNVLWRLQNGEFPEELNPEVIWLVIGTNDLAMKQCSEEVVLLGILRVIEEIESLKPNAKIVVNSILPMTTDEKGRVPPFSYKQLRKRKKRKPANFRRLDVLETSEKEEKKIKAPTVSIRKRRNPFSRVKISMWPSVMAINEELKRFCAKHKHMVFFDAYNIFVEKKEENKFPTIKQELMRSMVIGTPSKQGHEEWHVAIKRKLRYIFNKGKSKSDLKEKKTVQVEEKALTKEDNNDETGKKAATSKDDTEAEGSKEEIAQAELKEEEEDEN